MTAVRGRARCGARQVARSIVLGSFALLGLFAAGCGNDNFYYGTAVITVSATPGPFDAYLVDIYSVVLTRTDGTQTNLFGTNIVNPEERVDLTKAVDIKELWGAPAVLTGTYTSATVTLDYTNATIAIDVNGVPQIATIYDTEGNLGPTTISYTLNFDQAHPLVLAQNTLTPVDLNFDLAASTVVDTSVSPPKVLVRPYVSLSTQPTNNKPLRSRGVYVTGDAAAGTFVLNGRPFYDVISNPYGAITVQTNAQTVYNVNGANYTGAAGLAAVNALPINTTLAAFGSLGSTPTMANNAITPTFEATQVIAGSSLESLAADRVIGTVTSRTATSLNLHGAEVITRPGVVVQNTSSYQLIEFFPDLTVPFNSSTLVVVDGQPQTSATTQSISIGQQVDLEGNATLSNSAVVGVDASGGFVRLTSTPAWGTLNVAPQAGAPTFMNLASLGGYPPGVLTFTGTGATSSGGADANPTAYEVSTGTLNLSGATQGTALQFTGIVTPFGSAPPDFSATGVTLASAADQVLEVDYLGTDGAAAPFASPVTSGSTSLVLNLSNPDLGTQHFIRNGPFTVDLTNPVTNVTIVPDPTLNNQFAFGNPGVPSTTEVSVYNTFSGLVGKLASVLNGTNTLEKIVAVGRYDPTTATFTAYRIDVVQWQ